MSDVNGPACACCGERYDFANRPVKIENCCHGCLPPGNYSNEDTVRGLRGWARAVREEHFLTAAEVMERAAHQLAADPDMALLADKLTPDGMRAVKAELDRLRSRVASLEAADLRLTPEWGALVEASERTDLRSVDAAVNLATAALSLVIATRTDPSDG